MTVDRLTTVVRETHAATPSLASSSKKLSVLQVLAVTIASSANSAIHAVTQLTSVTCPKFAVGRVDSAHRMFTLKMEALAVSAIVELERQLVKFANSPEKTSEPYYLHTFNYLIRLLFQWKLPDFELTV